MAAGDLITADDQIEWRGLILGRGTPYGWKQVDGLRDLPDISGGDTQRTDRHGLYPGTTLAGGRTITFTYITKRVAPAAFPAAVASLLAATALREGADEEPLVVRLHGTLYQVWARCVRRTMPLDAHYTIGKAKGAIQWRASNPRVQQLPQVDVPIGLPASLSTGLIVPLTFPLDFGPGQTGGETTVTNLGNTDAWPTFRFSGPVTGPRILAPDVGGALVFDGAWTVPAGQTIEVDTDARTVTIVGSGVSRDDRLFTRQWFPLAPGPTRIQWQSTGGYDPAAALHVLYHHTSN
ncbi:MAG TPA: hypothetical protein VM677_27210 [Actinokineospora sp.]|nr:hypothetical protein [Actinokineospora sp.]